MNSFWRTCLQKNINLYNNKKVILFSTVSDSGTQEKRAASSHEGNNNKMKPCGNGKMAEEGKIENKLMKKDGERWKKRRREKETEKERV